MRIINIVDNASQLNYGVWHAAIINAHLLNQRGISTEIWYSIPREFVPVKGVTDVYVPTESIDALTRLISERKLDPSSDIICTHGCWRFPTRWGSYLKKQGFKWIFVPQGMLEYWPLQQKKLKKILYFNFLERRLIKNADVIRAVSVIEENNLRSMFRGSHVEYIPNAVAVNSEPVSLKPDLCQYLFLSRLHPKKNVLSLASAWLNSGLNNHPEYRLVIVGPDQGDLPALQALVARSTNVNYLGSVFGEEKNKIINASTFFVLPSFSEGLPSSLLEAMASGLVPIITEGCNLPEVYELNLGVKITTATESITDALKETSVWNAAKITNTSLKCRQFITDHYSLETITEKQVALLDTLIKPVKHGVSRK